MFLTEYDEEKERAKALKEQERLIQEAKQEAKQEAELQANARIARDMLRDRKPLAEILKYSRLPETEVRQLADSLGIGVLS